MEEALLVVQLVQAAVSAGLNLVPLLEKVSALIVTRHAAGETITEADLKAQFDEGDAIEAAALKQFTDTLADPNTPKLA